MRNLLSLLNIANGVIFIFLNSLFIETFLLKILKLLVEGSKLVISIFECFKAAYTVYRPMFAPISQKINFFSFSKLLIQLNVSGSLLKKFFILNSVSLFGVKNLIFLFKIFTTL